MASHITEHKEGGLTELPATAICGNDITSSCLYVSALAIIQAGQYAWVALLIVAGVLFLYRRIYGEVVGALLVSEQDDIMLITDAGKLVRTRVDEISVMGRNTQGVRLISLSEGERLVGLDRIVEDT